MFAPRIAKWSIYLGMGLAFGGIGWGAKQSMGQPATPPSTQTTAATQPMAATQPAIVAPMTQASAEAMSLPDLATTQQAETMLPDGLKMVRLQAGSPQVRVGDVVWVHYTGTLENGTKFDSSHDHADRGPLQFQVGAKKVITGWDEGIVGMTVGEKRRLVIPPALAYGAEGRGDAIPKNATLIFEVELVGMARP